MLRRGRTATSLSVPRHKLKSEKDCMYHAMGVLRSQGLKLYGLEEWFPRLEQITIGRRCPTEASNPPSRYSCKACQDGDLVNLASDACSQEPRYDPPFLCTVYKVCTIIQCFVGLLTSGSS